MNSPPRPLTSDDWQRINQLFHEALEQPPDARRAFVAAACADHPVLLEEISSLLDAHERAAAFMDSGGTARVEAAAASGDMVGRQVGHYHIERVLGEGGMGVVYLAEDTRLGRTVALKAVAARFVDDERRRERLRREARAAAALSHPAIATIYALEEIDGHVFIAGEYVPGETLREELARGAVDPARAIDTVVRIGQALAAAHDRGVIHRDLKPENVMRTPGGDVKILDFGLARFRDAPAALAHLTDDGAVLGTPAYMSPEQIRGATVDGRSDLFSLGVVFYELLSGRHPFADGDTSSTIARILEADPPRLRGSGSTLDGAMIPAALEEIVLTCLRKAPEARYRSVHEFLRAVERLDATPARHGSRSSGISSNAGGVGAGSAATSAQWWWKFHQAATSAAYVALLIALWMVRRWLVEEVGRGGTLVFTAALIGALVSVTLRWHLWFTLQSYPAEWPRQATSVRWWIRGGDALFTLALFAAAALIHGTHDAMSTALIAAGVAIFLSFTIIEPATTRAAFTSDA